MSQNTSRVERFIVRARQQQLAPLKYVHDEEHLYLGRRYPLMIVAAEGRQTNVVFTGQEIRIEIRKDSKADVRAVLHDWYCQQAQLVLTERLQLIKERAMIEEQGSETIHKNPWNECQSQIQMCSPIN